MTTKMQKKNETTITTTLRRNAEGGLGRKESIRAPILTDLRIAREAVPRPRPSRHRARERPVDEHPSLPS